MPNQEETTAAMFERMFHDANCPEAKKQVVGMARIAAVRVEAASGGPIEHKYHGMERDYRYGNRFYFEDGSTVMLGMVD
jgi:hypothetical protein